MILVLRRHKQANATNFQPSKNNLKELLQYPAMASIATLILHFTVGSVWAVSALIGFVGLPLMGTLVTADDDLPGGWSNPDGTNIPPWRMAPFWGQIAMGVAVSAFVAAIEFRDISFALAGLVAGTVAFFLLRHQFR